VPTLLVDEEHALDPGPELDRPHRVLAGPAVRLLAFQHGALAPSGKRVEPHADLHLAHVRVERHEASPGVAVRLPRLPGGRRRNGRVVVLEQRHFLVVDEAHEGEVVLLQSPRAGLQ